MPAAGRPAVSGCTMTTTPTPPASTASAPTAEPAKADEATKQGAPKPLTLLYDGECPLCLREVAALRSRAASFETSPVEFVDIASPDYDAAAHGGVSFETAMLRIHAIMPDGEIVSGIDVFRRVYDALGMGWMYAWTQLPVVGQAAAAVYDMWAERRLALTGRPALEEVMKMREAAAAAAAAKEGDGCDPEEGCSIDGRH